MYSHKNFNLKLFFLTIFFIFICFVFVFSKNSDISVFDIYSDQSSEFNKYAKNYKQENNIFNFINYDTQNSLFLRAFFYNSNKNIYKKNQNSKKKVIFQNQYFIDNLITPFILSNILKDTNIFNNHFYPEYYENQIKKNMENALTENIDEKDEIIYDENEKLKMFADNLYIHENEKKINADGNVKVLYKDTTLYADDLEYTDGINFGKTKGKARIRDSKNFIKGEALEYSVDTETGTILNAKTFSQVWILFGKRMEKVSKEKAICYHGIITSCDHKNPHYYFKASKIVIYFEKKFIAYNVVLYIKGIPVFYIPIWRQSLKKKKLQITISGGQSTTSGIYGKVKAKYSFDSDNSLTLQVDEYELRGHGLGMQYDYKKKDRVIGSIYLYGIDDKVDFSNKRTARIRHSQNFGKYLRSYTNINYQNDESFYKTYYYSGSSSQLEPTDSQVNGNIYSYSSLNYTKNLYYMNLLWESEQNWDNTKKDYVKTREILPSFDFSTNKNKFFINKLYYKYNFNFSNNYDNVSDEYYLNGHTYFNLTNTTRISKDITLTPAIGIRETMNSEKDKNGEWKENFSTKMDSSINLRNRLTRDMDLDLTYNYVSGILDNKSIDTNKLNLSLNTYLFMGDLRINNYTAYDFKKLDIANELKRFDDFSTEIRYKMSRLFNFYAKHQYNFNTEKTSLVQSIFYFYPTARLTFMENMSYIRANQGVVDLISTIKYRPNLKWKIDFSYRTEYDYLEKKFSPFVSKEFAIYRDLHCWEAKFSVLEKRISDGSLEREFWITLKLKAIPNQAISLYRNNREYNKWYEWDFKNRT